MIEHAPVTRPVERSGRHRKLRRRSPRRRWLLGSLLLLLVIGAAAGWLGWRASEARGDLRTAADLVSGLRQQLGGHDVAAARTTLTQLQQATGSARNETSDPLWSAGAHLPWIGDDLHAVHALSEAADRLSRDALPGLVAAAAALDPAQLTPHNGRIPLGPLVSAAPAVVAGDVAVRSIATTVAELETPGLTAPVRAAVRSLSARLATAQTDTAAAVRLVTLLPPMLGANGPRTYLLVFQNLAEARATGGIWGAWATVHADAGQLTMVRQGSAADINNKLGDVSLDPAITHLYGAQMAHFFQDANFTPDFPAAAQLGREMYRQAYGETVDGVLATDPVALSFLLRGAAPVALPSGKSLTAANAVSLLLNEVYLSVAEPTQQDVVFAAAARAAFGAVAGGGAGPQAMDGLRQAASAGHLLVWSAHGNEQSTIAQTALAGALTGPAAGDIGVYLNDDTGAKMDYYLKESIDSRCLAGDGSAEVTVTLESTAPTGSLPAYVTGHPMAGHSRNSFRTNVLIVAPVGGGIESATVDGHDEALGTGTDSGRQVGVVTVDLAPGERRVVVVRVARAPGAPLGEAPTVRTGSAIGVTMHRQDAC